MLTIQRCNFSVLIELHFFNELLHSDWFDYSALLQHLHPKSMLISVVELSLVHDHQYKSIIKVCLF